jgi:tripartite-type tricarboxylate transporter receptor subunit TctC
MTKLLRRELLCAIAAAVALPPIPALLAAEAYPSRPLRLIVGFAAGGTLDALARIIGQSLSDRLGQPLIVENRAGANGNLATESVVRAPPDGYTLLLIGTSNTINTSLYTDLSFNFDRDIAPVASISRNPLVMVVNPSLPAQSVADFIAYAKANAGKISMASAGIGSPQHVAGELFNMMAGVRLLHVPYRGEAAAMPDLLGDRVQVMFSTMVASLEQIRAGKLRPLAVSTTVRQNVLPEVPPMNESLPGYEASGWGGVGVPKNTPHEIVERLNKEINASLDEPSVKARLSQLGLGVFKTSPADVQKFIAEDTDKWAKVVRFAGLKAD